MVYITSPNPWVGIIPTILQQPIHQDIVLPRFVLPHPREVGMAKSMGEPQGQLADYRMTTSDGKSIHVREYENEYRVHWDKFDPAIDWINHLRYDAPHWWVILTTAAGGAFGCTASRDRVKGTIIGAVCGLIFGLITLPSD